MFWVNGWVWAKLGESSRLAWADTHILSEAVGSGYRGELFQTNPQDLRESLLLCWRQGQNLELWS